MDINLVLRSKIVHCSLNVENAINELLLKYLLITDKTKTKNFGNRAGISFKNKIDLLFDIDVFDKDELYIVELLMVFRNKFLHDIKYSSFTILLNDLDASIRNKFLKLFFDENDENDENEKGYEKAFMNLYEKVVEIINEKTEEVNNYSRTKIKFLEFQNNFLHTLINESLTLSQDLNNIIEDVRDEKIKKQVKQRIAQFEHKINHKENIEILIDYLHNNIVKLMFK